MSNASAFQVLSSLANLSRRSAKGLPEQIDTAPRWSGVGFMLMGQRFVSEMGQVSELMEVPESTRLPGVQPWVVGLSNVRGRLLPLFDLSIYFGGRMTTNRKSQRVLVLETDTMYSGVLVDRSFGMQHFNSNNYGKFEGELPAEVAPFVEGAYKEENGEPWAVFNMSTLTDDPRFINAAMS